MQQDLFDMETAIAENVKAICLLHEADVFGPDAIRRLVAVLDACGQSDLAARLRSRPIVVNAITFAGTGTFVILSQRPLMSEFTANPQGTGWHEKTRSMSGKALFSKRYSSDWSGRASACAKPAAAPVAMPPAGST